MKKIISLLLFPAPFLILSAQGSDTVVTKTGPLIIQPVLHSAMVISWNGKTIYSDPYGGAKAYNRLAEPDLVLITDIHGDHLNIETLKSIKTERAEFVVPQAVSDQLPDEFKKRLHILKNGETKEITGIKITAVPMYNLPEEADSKHVKGRGNGYVLRLGDKNVYISGDTEDIHEMRDLKNIDIAFVCMNLPYTMDIIQAKEAVLAFQPKIVYPFHYRGKDGYSDVKAFKKSVNKADPSIDVRLRNWYREY